MLLALAPGRQKQLMSGYRWSETNAKPGKVVYTQISTKDLCRSRAEETEAQRRTGQRKTCHDPGLSQFWYVQTEDYKL